MMVSSSPHGEQPRTNTCFSAATPQAHSSISQAAILVIKVIKVKAFFFSFFPELDL